MASSTKPRGVSGLYAPGGFIQPREHNPALRWPLDVGDALTPGVWERFVLTDAVVASCVLAVVLPIAQAEWEINPPDEPEEIEGQDEPEEIEGQDEPEDPEDDAPPAPEKDAGEAGPGSADDGEAPGAGTSDASEDLAGKPQEDPLKPAPVDEITAFVRAAFFDHLKPGLKATIREIVRSAVTCGHHVVEPIFRVMEDGGQWDGKVSLRTLAARPAWTIQRWNFDVTTGDLVSIVQGAQDPEGRWQEPELKADEILIFTHDQVGNDPRGRSLLRPIYLPARTKELILKLIGIRNERQALGVPIATIPPGLDGDSRKDLARSLRELRAHEQSYILIPEGVTLAWAEGPSNNAQAMREDLAALDLQIRTAFLQHFQALGTTETGARSVGEIHAALFYLALTAIAEMVVDVFNVLIERLVDLNFGPQEAYPYFCAPKIRAEDVKEALSPLIEAVKGGILTKDETVEARTREVLGLPPKKDPPPPPPGTVPPGAPPDPNAPPPPPGTPPAPPAKAPPPPAPPAQMAERAEGVALMFHPPRMLTAPEQRCAFGEMAERFDRAGPELQAMVGQAIRRNRKAIISWIRPLARRMAEGDSSAFEALQAKDLPKAVRAAIVAACQSYAADLEEFGRSHAERERRLAPAVAERDAHAAAQAVREAVPAPAEPPVPALGFAEASEPTTKAEAGIYGDRIADELLRLVRLATTRAAQTKPRARHPDGSRAPYPALNHVLDEVERVVTFSSDSMGVVRDSALALSVKAVSGGRREVFREHADEIASVSYSAVMDQSTCPECEAADGSSAPSMDAAEDGAIPPTPNPRCQGTAARCRCIWVVDYTP